MDVDKSSFKPLENQPPINKTPTGSKSNIVQGHIYSPKDEPKLSGKLTHYESDSDTESIGSTSSEHFNAEVAVIASDSEAELAQELISHMDEHGQVTRTATPAETPVQHLEVSLYEAKATDSFKKDGSAVSGTGSGTYLLLKGIKDPRFQVQVEKSWSKDSSNAPPVGYDDSTGKAIIEIKNTSNNSIHHVQIDVNEMSDRLLIPVEQIKEHASKGTLTELLTSEKKNNKLQNLPRVMDSYAKTAKNSAEAGLDAKTTMKIVRSYYKSGVEEQHSVDIQLKDKEGKANKYSNVHVYAKKVGGDEIHLTKLNKILGSGTYGIAYAVSEGTKEFAMKRAKTEQELVDEGLTPDDIANVLHDAQISVPNEIKMLDFVHSQEGGPFPEIQDKPHMVHNLADGTSTYVTTLYNKQNAKDFAKSEEFARLPMLEKLKMCRDPIKGCAILEDLGVVHLDIKPENFFIQGRKLKIGDFGDVCTYADHVRRNEPPILTPEFVPVLDYQSNHLDFSSVSYELGTSLFFMLTKEYPYQLQDRLANYETPFRKELLQGYPKEIVSIIERLCEPDQYSRLSTFDALDEFDKALQDFPFLADGLSELNRGPLSLEDAFNKLADAPDGSFILYEPEKGNPETTEFNRIVSFFNSEGQLQNIPFKLVDGKIEVLGDKTYNTFKEAMDNLAAQNNLSSAI
jgi:serine/threonine protein kinase